MDCSDKCKNMESMNHAKEWSFLWVGDPVLEEGDVFEADSHGWSQEVWVLLPHLSGFSCSIRCDQGHGAAAALTEIFFSVGEWGILILLSEFFTFLGRCWSLRCTLGELLLQAEMLHLAGQSGQWLWKPHCVWHTVSNTTPPFPFLISGLGPIPAPWQWSGRFGHCLRASCGQPPALQRGRCTWQCVLVPVSRGLTAGGKISWIGLTLELFGHQHGNQCSSQCYWKSQEVSSLCHVKLAREKGLISYRVLRQGHLDNGPLQKVFKICLILLTEIQISKASEVLLHLGLTVK